MKIYTDRTEFGWPGDNGIGKRLIGQILQGKKTATCSLKESYTESELADLLATKGKIVTVFDHRGQPHCNIQIVDVFETTFGTPDPRLVQGEGHGNDTARFQAVHRVAWPDEVSQGIHLDDATVLIVELFQLVDTP